MALAQGKRIAVTALLRSAENRQAVAEALEDERHVALETRLGRLAELGAAVVGAVPPDLLLLDLDLDDEAEMAVLAGLINASGGITAIAVTAAQPSLAGMRRLMRLGITDLVPQPIVRTDLLNALKTARDSGGRRNAESGGANGTVLAFLKAGGGVGATTLAVQAGCALAAAKGASVCLLDLDVQFGAAAYQLDLPQKASVVELIADPGRLDGSMLRGAMARHACGLDVLTAPRQVYPLEVLAAEGVQRLIEAARREYRTVLVDLPPCWCAGLHAALGTADMAALVLLMSVPSIHQARRQMETLAEESLDGLPLALVANRVERGLFRKGVPRKEAEKALKRSLSLLISDEARLMAESANAGRPLGAVEGGGKLARALAGQIGSLLATPAAGHAASA